MSKHSVTVTMNHVGVGRIKLDGTDISNVVRGVEFSGRVGETPEVRLELSALEIELLQADRAEVALTSDVHDALVTLGWTPPLADA